MPAVLGVKNSSISSNTLLVTKAAGAFRRKNFKKTFIVLADTVSQIDDDILATAGIPPLFSVLNSAFCVGLHPKEEDRIRRHPVTGVPTILWEVVADFDSNLDRTEEEEDKPPESKTPKTNWSGETEEEVLTEDVITGEAIQTKAEEPIIITGSVVRPILEIRRYEFWPFDPDTIVNFAAKVNSTEFYGAPEGSALMLPMSTEEQLIEQIRYNIVTYRIKFNIKPTDFGPEGLKPDTWKAKILHHGFKHRVRFGAGNIPGEPEVFTDKFGNPATVNLDIEGVKLADKADPVFLEFNRYSKVDFNILSLGPF